MRNGIGELNVNLVILFITIIVDKLFVEKSKISKVVLYDMYIKKVVDVIINKTKTYMYLCNKDYLMILICSSFSYS
jgi:hypothetical protein